MTCIFSRHIFFLALPGFDYHNLKLNHGGLLGCMVSDVRVLADGFLFSSLVESKNLVCWMNWHRLNLNKIQNKSISNSIL